MLVPCLAYFSAKKMERHVPPKRRLTFSRLHGVISQTTELCIRIVFFPYVQPPPPFPSRILARWPNHFCTCNGNETRRYFAISVRVAQSLWPLVQEPSNASVVYWSEFLATDAEVRVWFSALLDFLRSSGSGTRSTQPREYNWGATWKK
jgi:hypothetical protein